jgi:hypothetical protein
MAKRKKDSEDIVNRAPAEPAVKPKRVTKPRSTAAQKAAAPAPSRAAEATPSPPPDVTSSVSAEPAWPGPAVEPAGAPNGVGPERIASRAYEIYQSRGGSHGDPLQDWLQAERELKDSPRSH